MLHLASDPKRQTDTWPCATLLRGFSPPMSRVPNTPQPTEHTHIKTQLIVCATTRGNGRHASKHARSETPQREHNNPFTGTDPSLRTGSLVEKELFNDTRSIKDTLELLNAFAHRSRISECHTNKVATRGPFTFPLTYKAAL